MSACADSCRMGSPNGKDHAQQKDLKANWIKSKYIHLSQNVLNTFGFSILDRARLHIVGEERGESAQGSHNSFWPSSLEYFVFTEIGVYCRQYFAEVKLIETILLVEDVDEFS